MKNRAWVLVVGMLLGLLLGVSRFGSAQVKLAVRPVRLEPLENLGVRAEESRRPVYLPAEWGRLISVVKTGSLDYTLFLEAPSGEIYLVRLVQSGDYLFLDTRDAGGVALVIQRKP